MSEDPRYPTRSYPYRAELTAVRAPQASVTESVEALAGPALKRRLVGLDAAVGRDMSADERARLDDPLARLVLKRGQFPRTLHELLAALDAFNADPDGLPQQDVFIVSEWGQIPLGQDGERFARGLRYVIARRRQATAGADLLISTAPPSDDRGMFLQVAGWDATNGVFHYYERELMTQTWFWEGSSWHAFDAATKGKGPFDSHVNGSLVMKERKVPWLHWNSVSQIIPRNNFPADHPVNRPSENGLIAAAESAHVLQQQIVEPAIIRWTKARLGRELGAEGSGDHAALMRHVLTATSVNIASAQQRSQSEELEISLPLTLFVDADLLEAFLPDIPLSLVLVGRPLYQQAISALQVALRDTKQGFRQDGDAFFAWPVPERAFEDITVVTELVQRRILTAQFATALLMIDFPNPIDSARRAALMRHVPPRGSVTPDRLQAAMQQAIGAAALAGGADEAEIMRFMALDAGQWPDDAGQKIAALFAAILPRAKTIDGVTDYLRLADGRRRAFRRGRRLAEFDLSLPFSMVADDAPPVELLPDGSVAPRVAATA